jgi:hypothetical protein
MIVPEEILFLLSVNYENRGVTSDRAFTSIGPQKERVELSALAEISTARKVQQYRCRRYRASD